MHLLGIGVPMRKPSYILGRPPENNMTPLQLNAQLRDQVVNINNYDGVVVDQQVNVVPNMSTGVVNVGVPMVNKPLPNMNAPS
eukprot:CAMPEP_0176363310 /NCGR_PEP_ID=MMETSP0126-20121128/19025_1 /TAXON_ID=141414 ORGANISM="Strombidinopsis acuminatum, Strain SPMC142" /NCGR_SAMPLE_ID=MMETSP0126 /ASSEMBLY_ACC=CAM_ASM_000229 /LENGTH=82 /DNA_ID=CAMNT_0017719549 /DNA_START=886 /DNA_END=1134 /DNA_ORIENTATION=-